MNITRVDVDFSSGVGSRWTNPKFVEINPNNNILEITWDCHGSEIQTIIPISNADKIEIVRGGSEDDE